MSIILGAKINAILPKRSRGDTIATIDALFNVHVAAVVDIARGWVLQDFALRQRYLRRRRNLLTKSARMPGSARGTEIRLMPLTREHVLALATLS